MIVSAALDFIRSKLGVPDIDPAELKMFLDGGRHELESQGNYYFMTGVKDHTLTASSQSYSLTATSGTGLSLTDYKAHRALFIRSVGGTQWLPLEIGSWQSAIDAHPTTPEAKPQMAVIDNETIYFFPTPNDAYPIKLLHWNYTSNPANVTNTDEMLTRWYMALIYASVMVGKKYITQDENAGANWEKLMVQQVKRLKKITNERLGEDVNTMDTSEAAQILQAAAGENR